MPLIYEFVLGTIVLQQDNLSTLLLYTQVYEWVPR